MIPTRPLLAPAAVLLSLALIHGCSSEDSSGAATDRDSTADASYRVTFTTNWTQADFPTNYPGGAHFTNLIGATHDAGTTFWEPGEVATPGIEQMAETGKTGNLSAEISAAKVLGGAEFALGGSSAGASDTVSFEFDINATHGQVTLVTMVAPSPDWFVGVHGLELFDTATGEWKDSVPMDLLVYDAGTEDGTGFSLSNPASDPQQPISLLTTDSAATDFAAGVHRNSRKTIAKMTFTRIR